MNGIPLVEVFKSIQGEGFNAGRDAVFVRFSGCNLSCVFAEGAVCDTPYMKANLKPSLSELFDQYIDGLVQSNSATWSNPVDDRPMLILTGGEPTLAQAFDDVAFEGKKRGMYVAVETNGTKWRTGLMHCNWISISPKATVKQGSPSPFHNHNPQSTALDMRLVEHMETRGFGEYRYVIGSGDEPEPPILPAQRHYLSPAILSDGSGLEWQRGFPGFVPGTVERCLEIISINPSFRLSIQSHKVLKVR